MECKNVTPAITGATATISKSFRKYLACVPGKHEIRDIQKYIWHYTRTSGSANKSTKHSTQEATLHVQ
jgi:mannose-1-phosphate guanylyltransferase